MLANIKYDVIRFLSEVQIHTQEEIDAAEEQRREQESKVKMKTTHAEASALTGQSEEASEDVQKVETFKRDGKKVGRNEPCPCGSGKKFKQCHGALS